MIMLALTLSALAGLVVLVGLLARHGMRATARFLFTPGADDDWMAPLAIPRASRGQEPDEKHHCQGPSAGGKLE